MLISGFPAGRQRFAAALAASLISSTVFSVPDLAPAATRSPSVPAPQLDWSPCAQDREFDCATAKVPLDYRSPGGRTIELAVVKRKATGTGHRIGTLFFSPGGPGGPGTVQMPQVYEHFPQQVRERFDVVSWDPRGIGNSTAVNCFDSPEEADAWTAGRPAGFPVGEQQRMTWIAAYRDLARRCHRRGPELLRHVSTADTALDLDQLRRAVGDPQLTYLGVSYGSFRAHARLLTHHGYGHTELINPSSCVGGHESRYLIDGTLPPAGTTCQQDTPPFAATRPQGGVATGGGAMAGIAS
ncbi:alpha/beta fold hydrolase [Streptomyces decoyicus]|uniref:alpha/beta fold hydrolase n=1 Tax=Streptomyces decoyicus TaxID=249567 RepID=UPI003807823B